jgi:hypothetical protein
MANVVQAEPGTWPARFVRFSVIATLATLPAFASAQTVQTTTNPNSTTTVVTTVPTGSAATQAQVSANTSAFAGSGLSGGVTLGAGTGTLESNILSAISLKHAAKLVFQEEQSGSSKGWQMLQSTTLKSSPPYKNTVTPPGSVTLPPATLGPLIVPGEGIPDFSAKSIFDQRRETLTRQLTNDLSLLAAAVAETKPPGKTAESKELTTSSIPSLVGMGLGVTDIGKLLSYGATTTQSVGNTVSFDDVALAVALSAYAKNQNQYWPIFGQVDAAPSIDSVANQLSSLNDLVQKANVDVASATLVLAPIAAIDRPNARQKQQIKDLQTGLAAVTGDVAAYNVFLLNLTTPGPTSLFSIAQAKVFEDIASVRGIILVHVVNAAGGVVANQAFAGVFGTPIKAAGGVTVYYSFVKALDNSTNSSDVITSITPYHTLSKTDASVVFDRYGLCDSYDTSDFDSNQRKYCPVAWPASP